MMTKGCLELEANKLYDIAYKLYKAAKMVVLVRLANDQ